MSTICLSGTIQRFNFNPNNNGFSYIMLGGKAIELRTVDHSINKLLALTQSGDHVALWLRPSYTPPSQKFDEESVETVICDLLSFHNDALGKNAGEVPDAQA